MGCPKEVVLEDNLTFTVNTHDITSNAAATDADSPPTYRVYEEETGTAILNGTMALLDDANTTGFYSELIACTAANGFESGKTYGLYIEATVNSVQGGIAYNFICYTAALGGVNVGNNYCFYVTTHDPTDNSKLFDADAVPSYRVYEDETATPLLTGSMAKLDDANTLGFYSESIACTTGNGFEAGKSYTVYISSTVSAIVGTTSISFQCVTASVPTWDAVSGVSHVYSPGNGVIRVEWGAATGETGFYIYVSTSTAPWTSGAIGGVAPAGSTAAEIRFKSQAAGTRLVDGELVYIGVRAFNAAGIETNTVETTGAALGGGTAIIVNAPIGGY